MKNLQQELRAQIEKHIDEFFSVGGQIVHVPPATSGVFTEDNPKGKRPVKLKKPEKTNKEGHYDEFNDLY